jgi:hypothetical protein
MAVGSPALTTYSLILTTLNRRWVRKKIAGLEDTYQTAAEYVTILPAVELLLAEAQQVPLRAIQQHGWLSSLLVRPGNRVWWSTLRERLESTRRGVTFSLFAQGFSAFIAWVFVIASAFIASLGQPSVALQISSGSIWAWMVRISSCACHLRC